MMRLTIPLADRSLLTPYVRRALELARELATVEDHGSSIVGSVGTVSREAMRPFLELGTRINEELIRRGIVGPNLYEGRRTRYAVEPPGHEDWDTGDVLEERRWGDCEDLAMKRAADLREAGERGARADSYHSRTRPDGRRVWHSIVVRSDGSVEDPSAHLGMPVKRRHLRDGQSFAELLAERGPSASMGGPLTISIRHDSMGQEGATARAMRLMREGRIARPGSRAELAREHWRSVRRRELELEPVSDWLEPLEGL